MIKLSSRFAKLVHLQPNMSIEWSFICFTYQSQTCYKEKLILVPSHVKSNNNKLLLIFVLDKKLIISRSSKIFFHFQKKMLSDYLIGNLGIQIIIPISGRVVSGCYCYRILNNYYLFFMSAYSSPLLNTGLPKCALCIANC